MYWLIIIFSLPAKMLSNSILWFKLWNLRDTLYIIKNDLYIRLLWILTCISRNDNENSRINKQTLIQCIIHYFISILLRCIYLNWSIYILLISWYSVKTNIMSLKRSTKIHRKRICFNLTQQINTSFKKLLIYYYLS